MANLTPEQRQLVAQWAAEGANLNQIQDRLRSECETTLTYMETRLLIMELGIKLQEKPREVPPEEKPAPPPPETPAGDDAAVAGEAPADSSLKVSVDEVPPPGAVISGRASFSDGVTVQWFMDEQGRFGMRGPAPGYQPPPADIPAFQAELDNILQLRGF
ncbi:hypothetical protein [Prosthecobacter sp.]|uniref:hypothetical protein n=1 Tax=Prosthecobacter sp. TaxID=1965333 RepID=UPI00248876BD|nr:hypothetical protein [Prosthecobacter sp.]MDI1314082.1 hypothetical protein [Prosthecobacter sp.]